MSKSLGKRGESIFSTIITRYMNGNETLLDPVFLGDSFPTVDYYVGLNKYPKKKGFFFASVKLTTRGFSHKNSKLKIRVSKKDIALLNKYTVPVYLLGIDDNKTKEGGYFISANNLDLNFNGLPVIYPVNNSNLEKLWREVQEYWENNKEITNFVSSFK